MSTLVIDGVRKSYSAMQVLHGVDLAIADGEFIVLVGPSGCGKSTLLRMIAGLEEITHGDILIDGEVVNWVTPKDRGIAMVFQNYALYPHMTVAENMAFSLKLSRLDQPAIDKKVNDAAQMLGLSSLLRRRPGELSGGQRQRVAMGRALVRDPKVFLFDEPLSNLDAKLRVQMRTEIRALQRRLGTTTVYVTHDQVEAMTMADRIVVMNAGRVEQIGTPLNVYDHPANTFVAGFIGSPAMNLVNGQFLADGRSFQTDKGALIALPPAARVPAPGPGTLGIRPQNLRVGSAVPALTARVLAIEPTGAETLLICDFEGQSLSVQTQARLDLGQGDQIQLGFDEEPPLCFDAEGNSVVAGRGVVLAPAKERSA